MPIVFGRRSRARTAVRIGLGRLVDRLHQSYLVVQDDTGLGVLRLPCILRRTEAHVRYPLVQIMRYANTKVAKLFVLAIERLFDKLIRCLRMQRTNAQHFVRIPVAATASDVSPAARGGILIAVRRSIASPGAWGTGHTSSHSVWGHSLVRAIVVSSNTAASL